MAEGNEQKPVPSNAYFAVDLGILSDLNITNRSEAKIYIGIFNGDGTTLNSPVSGGGVAMLFLSGISLNWGVQLVMSDSGSFLYKRRLANGVYGEWTVV